HNENKLSNVINIGLQNCISKKVTILLSSMVIEEDNFNINYEKDTKFIMYPLIRNTEINNYTTNYTRGVIMIDRKLLLEINGIKTDIEKYDAIIYNLISVF